MTTQLPVNLEQIILDELKRQVDNAPGWVNDEGGLADIELDGRFSLIAVAEAIRKAAEVESPE